MNSKDKFDLIDWIGRKKTRWLLHFTFWLAVLIFYTFLFGSKNVNYNITFSFVIILLPVTIITTYFLNYELIPNYLFRKRYAKFFLYLIYTLIVSFYIEMVTVMGIFIVVSGLNLQELYPANTNALFLIAGMYVVVFLGVAIKLVNQYNQNQLEIQKLKGEKTEAELKFLKTQLHPHFLFNTLNNLYSLTLEKSDEASEVVLKLSELLNYILYECNTDLVPIDREIEQMENYIELEKLRYGPRLELDFIRPGHLSPRKVPPMLFITLLENSFKHGVSKSMKNSWIKMDLSFEDKSLIFKIHNSKHKSDTSAAVVSGGIGLKNLENRLKLMYKESFEMKINQDASSFHVSLKLQNQME